MLDNLKEAYREGGVKGILRSPVAENGVVPKSEALLFAIGIAGQNISCGMMFNWFYYFCTDVAHYNLKVIGVVLTIARIWDAFNDPLVGVLIDGHRFKNGEKLRPWLRIAPVVAGVATALLFIKPAGIDDSIALQSIFLLVIYLIYDLSYTVQDVSQWGMTAVMSPHSDERGLVSQIGRIGATVGSWIPGLIPVILSATNKAEISEKYVFAFLGIVCGLGGMLLAMSASHAKERVRSEPEKNAKTAFSSNIKMLFGNKMVMLILLSSILGGLTLTIPQTHFFKYKVAVDLFGHQMDGIGFMFIFGIVSGLPGTLSMLVASKFAKKVGGMKNILILSALCGILMRVAAFFVGYEGNKIIIIMLIFAVGNIPGGMIGIAQTALFGDSIDYMEWKTGKRAEAITFAAQTFCAKIGTAINTGMTTLTFILLHYSAEEFEAGKALSPEFDKWAWPLYILGPILGSVLNLIPLLFIKYPDSLKAQVEADLKARREHSEAEIAE